MKNTRLQSVLKTIVILLVLIVSISLLLAATTFSAEKKGNEAKGRFYFRNTCKNCHTKGAPGGEITPLSKTTVQWRNYFTKGVHNKGKEALNTVVTDEKITDVSTYLVAHAADSLQPETCGK